MHATLNYPVLEDRQAADCRDLRATRSASCWDELKIPEYLASWKTNTPVCTDPNNIAKCCKTDEKWSTCFLRLAKNGDGSTQCDKIGDGNCDDSRVDTASLDSSIVAQVSYVVSTLVAINSIFEGYYEGMTS